MKKKNSKEERKIIKDEKILTKWRKRKRENAKETKGEVERYLSKERGKK